MKYYLIVIILYLLSFNVNAQFSVSGGMGTPFRYSDGLSATGIEAIYFLNTLSNATISYSTSSASVVKFYKYTRSGSDQETVPSTDIMTTTSNETTTYTIINIEDSKGYYAQINGGTTSVIWIFDYSKHLPQLNSIEVDQENNICNDGSEEENYIKLLINKSDDLEFYTLNGATHNVIRRYTIEYNTQQWDEQNEKFTDTPVKLESLDIGTDYPIVAPLINTEFKLTGDQIAQSFGMNFEVFSSMYTSISVEAHILSEQLSETDNTDSELNAPVEFQFYGFANGEYESAYYYTWLIYKITDLENPIVRYTDRDIKYTFRESGTYQVTLEVFNKTSQCTDTTSIQISTSASELKVPNVLLLDGEHQFRVKYKSITNFTCTIFNRWGNKIYEFRDPSLSWDGKYKGRYVTPGVYFYVITATGGDGIRYKKGGDINVLRPK